MHRLRRLRRTDSLLRLFAETDVPVRSLVPAWFIVEGHGIRREVPEDSGLWQLSPDMAAAEAVIAQAGGAEAVMLFGVPHEKGITHAGDPNGLVCQAAHNLRGLGLTIMADVCLCSYTEDGHCGVWRDGMVQNDETVAHLARMAVTLADAGVDVVASFGELILRRFELWQVCYLCEHGLQHAEHLCLLPCGGGRLCDAAQRLYHAHSNHGEERDGEEDFHQGES